MSCRRRSAGRREYNLEAFGQKISRLFVESHVHERIVVDRRFVGPNLRCGAEARRDDDATAKIISGVAKREVQPYWRGVG